MFRSKTALGRSLMIGAAVVLGACGSSGSTDVAADGEGDITAEDFANTPLAELMGWNDALEDQDWQAQQREVEALIVECMAAEGFEYTPETFETTDFEDPYAAIEEEWGSRAFAEKWGYGIATTFELQQGEFAADTAESISEGEWVDPTEGMSDGERDAYYAALYGDYDEVDSSLTEEEQEAAWENYEPSGCQNEAADQVNGNDLLSDPEFEDLMQDLYERLEADPRVVQAEGEWSQCMAGKGYSFGDQSETFDAVTERMDEVWSSMSDPFESLTDEDFQNMSEDELRALETQTPEYDEELLAEVVAYEIDLAVADYDCGADAQRIFYEVQVELEQQFIDENREVIDRVQGASG